MLLYIIKSIIALSAMYVPYMLMLRRESFFRFNRLMLLGIMALSLTIPLIDVHEIALTSNISSSQTANAAPLTGGENSAISLLLSEVIVRPSGTAAAAPDVTNEGAALWTIVGGIYAIGMIVTLIAKLTQLAMLHRSMRRGVLWTDVRDGVTIYCHANNVAPFSWMRSIVISEHDYQTNAAIILNHEIAHIRHMHSLDILLLAVCQIVQWANPLVWVMETSLRDVHEYEADDTVLQAGVNAQQYQNLLIKKAVGSSSYAFANSLNHSLLKKRITMMLQKKSNPWMRTKALYLIPVAAVALSAFATPELINSVSPEADSEAANAGKVTTIPVNTEIAKAENDDTKSTATSAQAEAAIPDGKETILYTGTVEYPEDSVLHIGNMTYRVAYREAYPKEVAPEAPSPTNVENAEPDDEIWEIVEELPSYKGDKNSESLMELLMKNLKYPQTALDISMQGRLLVQFVVEKDGTCSNYKLIRISKAKSSAITVTANDPNAGQPGYITQEEYDAAQKALEEEAIRVVKLSSGDWTPGKQRGKTVRVKYSVPITFRLN
ncbi:MAG: hypothetical protein J1F40_08135 [Prevotellaceae bacterium]|nr:hypothetical protein [Prevotellaceae bacterium]